MQSTRPYNTLKIDHEVGSIAIVKDIDALRDAMSQDDNPIILGGGSNVLFTGDTDRRLIVIDLLGIQVMSEDDESVTIQAAAGEVWHDLVLWAIDHDYGGLENLSLIPGKCGAAPIQNIGAYGVELSDVLLSVTCMSRVNGALVNLSRSDCQLEYRSSIFKTDYRDQYVITSITIRLSKAGSHQINTTYGAINERIYHKGITTPSIRDVGDAVIEIRKSKLPDPAHLPNAGSFFKNPIISIEKYQSLKWRYPLMPSYPVSEGMCKVPAGWLIDQCGWKGVMVGEVGVHAHQALVIVNHGSDNGDDIVRLSKLIQDAVYHRYGLRLDTEVNFI